MELNDEQKLTVIGLAIAVAIGSAVYFYNHYLSPAKPAVVLDEPKTSFKPKNAESVTVHICGAVAREGVYKMFPGDRVINALKQAGGAKVNADLSALNLAEELKDGERIAVPEKRIATASSAQTGLPGRDNPPDAGGIVSLNTATESELDGLPGIGPATAKKIVEARPYSRIEDLLKIPRFGKSRLEKIKDRICL